MFDDGESKAGAGKDTRDRVIRLSKRIEDTRETIRRDADSGVGDRENELMCLSRAPRGAYREFHESLLGKFYSVSEKVDQALLNPERIPPKEVGNSRHDVVHQLDRTFVFSSGSHGTESLTHHVAQSKFYLLEGEVAGLHLREVEDLVDGVEKSER